MILGNRETIEWIDTGKGLGISLVVLGHTFCPVWLETIIYSFHMPFFFFVSGFLFKPRGDFRSFLSLKATRLLIPYFCFGIVSYGYWLLSNKVIGYTEEGPVFPPLLSLIIPFKKDYHVVGALWFLTSLYIVQVLYFVVRRRNSQYLEAALLLVCSIGGYCWGSIIPYRLPVFADVALTGFVFFSLGNYYSFIEKRQILGQNYYYLILPVLIFVNVLFSRLNGKISMAGLNYGNFVYFYISSISGIFAFITICKKLKRNEFISYLGRNSLIVLALHIIFFNILDFLRQNLLSIRYFELKGSLSAGLVHTIIILLAMVPFIAFLNRYFPYLVGRGRRVPNDFSGNVMKEQLKAHE
jgi:fucose 4-O-acetylase-like acetyltransferase